MKWTSADQRVDKMGDYRSVVGLRIDPNRARRRNLLRVKGWVSPVIISELVKQALTDIPSMGIHLQVT
jgi:hypothetical protein